MIHPEPRSAHPGVVAAHALVDLTHLLTAAAGSNLFPDFSEFNEAVDWGVLGALYREGTISAVAIRAGFGTVRPDARFAENQKGARAEGIPAIYYWFNYPAYNLPTAEAAMFNNVIGPLQPGEAMCGDFEDDPQAKPFPRGQAGFDWCRAFLTALQAPTDATWWYTYPSLLSSVGLQALETTWPFWEADYSATPDSAFAPAIARQFTDCGSTPGVGGCCDQSRVLRNPLARWLTPGLAATSTQGGDMSIAQRNDGSGLLDWFEASGPDRHCEHRGLTPGQPVGAAESIGGTGFVPGSFRAWWNATTTVLTVMGQVDNDPTAPAGEGSWWSIGWNGAWGKNPDGSFAWLPTGVSTALPATSPAQPDDDSAFVTRAQLNAAFDAAKAASGA